MDNTDLSAQLAHLKATTTDRGFTHMPEILGSYGARLSGSTVRVYESSAAEGPHIWLRACAPENLNYPDGPKVEAPVHLTLDNARLLRDQLTALIDNHYQVRH